MGLFFFSSGRRHTKLRRDWSSDVCSSGLNTNIPLFKIVEWRDRPSDLPAVATVVRILAQIKDHQAPLGNEHAVGDPNDPIPINL